MIINLKDLAEVRKRHATEKIVLTSGTFDLLHVGHLGYLRAVKALGDVVVVMLSGDARVKARKGSTRPIISETDRAQLIDALKMVDYVFIDPAATISDGADPLHLEIVKVLQPDVYATDGPDPRFWNSMDASKLVILPRSEGGKHASTSAIIEYIINRGMPSS